MTKQEYRPCPICKNIHSEECECCKGAGRFPYPWVLPGDKMVRKRWEDEENCIVYSALDPLDAYRRYVFVYGKTERSFSSVYRHWQYIHNTETTRPRWSPPEVDILNKASSYSIAIVEYHLVFGTLRSDCAVKTKYQRLHFQT